jgi:hypothetical protein
LKDISDNYAKLLLICFSGFLSQVVINRLSLKVKRTVDRCGLTQIANDFTRYSMINKVFSYDIFELFFNFGVRFQAKNAELRKVLSLLFATFVSKQQLLNFKQLFQNYLTQRTEIEVQKIFMLVDCSSKRFEIRDLTKKTFDVGDENNSEDDDWSLNIMSSLVQLFENTKQVSSIEMYHSNMFFLSAEKCFHDVFSSLSENNTVLFAKAAAFSIHLILDKNKCSRSNFFSSFNRVTTNHAKFLDELLYFIKVFLMILIYLFILIFPTLYRLLRMKNLFTISNIITNI